MSCQDSLGAPCTDMTGLLWDVAKITGASRAKPLTANERAACWADLAGTVRDACSSMWKLIADKDAVNSCARI
jgi:hypothetical protein